MTEDKDIFKFDIEQYKKWLLKQQKKRVQDLYYEKGFSFNQIMWNLGINYDSCCDLFKKFEFKRRSNDYDPTLKIG